MYVNIRGGEAKISVKYLYREADGHKEPYATQIYLTLPDDTQLEGYAQVKGTDKFSRLKGRRYAMMSLFKRDCNCRLSKWERYVLFTNICPEFFSPNYKFINNRKHQEKAERFTVTEDQLEKIKNEPNELDKFMSYGLFNWIGYKIKQLFKL